MSPTEIDPLCGDGAFLVAAYAALLGRASEPPPAGGGEPDAE